MRSKSSGPSELISSVDAKWKARIRNFRFNRRIREGIDQGQGSIWNLSGKIPRKAVGETSRHC